MKQLKISGSAGVVSRCTSHVSNVDEYLLWMNTFFVWIATCTRQVKALETQQQVPCKEMLMLNKCHMCPLEDSVVSDTKTLTEEVGYRGGFV